MGRLKEPSEYERQYDTFIIKRFLDRKKASTESVSDDEKEKALRDFTRELMLYFDKGEEWKAKRSTIEKWMDRDRRLDELYNNAQAPVGIYCTTCGDELEMNLKTPAEKDGKDDVLFFYRCSKKHRGRAFYSVGAAYISKPSLCVECGEDTLVSESGRDNDALTIIDTCTACGHVDSFTFDSDPEFTDEEFESLRAKYCLSDEEGEQYLDMLSSMEDMKKLQEQIQDREDTQAMYALIESIQRISVPQFKESMVKLMEDAAFSNIHFDDPVMKGDVQLKLYADDSTTANAYDREKSITKLIRKELAHTNWKLMNDGVSFRMGVFTIRFRGFDNEDDVKKLVEIRLKRGELELPGLSAGAEASNVTLAAGDGSIVIP